MRDLAATQGDTERALRAAEVAFREAPELDAYLRVEALAGDAWPRTRESLLDHLRHRQHGYSLAGPVDVLLHEGLVGDALDLVEGSWDFELIGRVVDAAAESYPDRVIPVCRAQADSIMDAGRASAYDSAVRWLRRARTAYRAANREAEWADYLSDLLTHHHKKHKLRPMLEGLRGR